MYQLKFALAFGLMWVCTPTIFAVHQPVTAVFAQPFTCPQLSVSVEGVGVGTASFDVLSGSGSVQYYFVRKENALPGTIRSAGNGALEVNGLPAGTYIFYFRSVCNGGPSEWFKTEDLIIS